MQNVTNHSTLHSSDIYADQFQLFQESQFFKRLQKKFTPLPFYRKYRALKNIALFASYLFNFFSALTAASLVFFFVESMAGNYWLSGIASGLFLALLEVTKRKTAAPLFKDWLQFRKANFGLSFFLALLVVLSVSFSFFGAKKLVTVFTPPPVLEDTGKATDPIHEQLTTIDGQIAKHLENKNHLGQVFVRSQRAAERLTIQREMLLAKLVDIEQKTTARNETTVADHSQLTAIKAEYFASVTLLLEMLFLLCCWFLQYYDFRSFTEFASTSQLSGLENESFAYTRNYNGSQDIKNGHHTVSSNNKIDPIKTAANGSDFTRLNTTNGLSIEAIQKAIKHVKGRIASASHRLRNGIGRPETSRRNIERHTAKLRELEALLG